MDFTEKVRNVVAKIPRGQTMTYKEVAKLAGNSNAARAVGSIMAKNFNPKIPCHRVIRSDSKVGNYNRGGTTQKIKLLSAEGVMEYKKTKKN